MGAKQEKYGYLTEWDQQKRIKPGNLEDQKVCRAGELRNHPPELSRTPTTSHATGELQAPSQD